MSLHLGDQVSRHARRQVRRAHDQVNARGGPGQEDGRLPGRVSATDHDDRFGAALARLGEFCARDPRGDSEVVLDPRRAPSEHNLTIHSSG
ncbi:hypothetical protein [Agromyces ramosus]|uniref:hypothetical protein n=1 Tax=Agromyces ramosus TaxID=33879 RepID=UPI001F5FE496|nr:hypothetical protein [Agromyces ramosus]